MPFVFKRAVLLRRLVPFRVIRVQQWPDRKREAALEGTDVRSSPPAQMFEAFSWFVVAHTTLWESALKHIVEDRGCGFLNSQILRGDNSKGTRGRRSMIRTKGFSSGDNYVVKILPIAGNIAAPEPVQYSLACCSFFSLSHSESSYSSEAASSSVIAGSGSSAKSALKNLATHSCPHGSSSRK